MLQEDVQTRLLEVFATEDRVQCCGSEEKEGKGNRGDKGEEEQKGEQSRYRGDRQMNGGHGGHGDGDEEDCGQSRSIGGRPTGNYSGN